MQASDHILDPSALSALLHQFFFPDNRDLAQLFGQMSNSDPDLLTLPQTGSVVTADIPQGEFSGWVYKGTKFLKKEVFNSGVTLLIFTGCSNFSVLLSSISFPLDSNFQVGCILCLNYIIMPHKTLC